MARVPGEGPTGYIHLPNIIYWMGFWAAGIYLPLLVFALFGATFNSGNHHSMMSGVLSTVRLAGFASLAYQVLMILYKKTSPTTLERIPFKAVAWGAFWTVIFFSSRMRSSCAVGIDSSACSQLHIIGVFLLGPVIFLYHTCLGFLGSLLEIRLFRRQ